MKTYAISVNASSIVASYTQMSDRPVGLVEIVMSADTPQRAYGFGKALGKDIFNGGFSVEVREIYSPSWLKRIFGIGR